MTAPKLLGVGAAHIRRVGRMSGEPADGACAPGTMREEIGGGAFVALRAAARHGIAATLLSVRGGDADGEAVARAAAREGIADISSTFLDRATPCTTVLLDRHGRPAAGLADTELYDLAFPRLLRRRSFRDAADAADALICDASLPEGALARIAAFAEKPVYAVAAAQQDAARFSPVLPAFTCLFCGRKAAAALTGLDEDAALPALAEALGRLRLRGAVIVDEAGAVSGFDGSGSFGLPAREAAAAAEALAGATVAAMMKGLSFAEAVRTGVALAGQAGAAAGIR